MSKIPFFFHSPTPRFFRDNGFFTNPKNKAFVDWCFERCCNEERTVYHENQTIILKPYQFIFGRKKCSIETGLTEDEVRTQQQRWEKLNFLQKAPNKTPKLFTIYEWVLTAFLKDDPQEKPQVTPKSPPSDPHNLEDKKKRSKEDHPSIPSFAQSQNRDDGQTDDFSSKLEKEESTEIYPGIFLTQQELDDCIKIKGSLESVKHAIEFIQTSKKRKFPITDWPNALSTWKIKNNTQDKIKEHLAYADKLINSFDDFQKGCGWRVDMYTDTVKDQKGVLFQPESAYKKSVFIPFVDGEFQKKCYALLIENKMVRGKKQE